MYIISWRKNQSKQINYKKRRRKMLVCEETRQNRRKKINISTLRRGWGIPIQSAKMSRMDSTLLTSSDLDNAEINTNMQLYYSTISGETNQLHTHTHTHTLTDNR